MQLLSGLLVVAIGSGAGIFFTRNKAQAGELALESSSSNGSNPWTPPTDQPPGTQPSATETPTVEPSVSPSPSPSESPSASPSASPAPPKLTQPPPVTVKLGTRYVPLYGGSGELTVCDKAKLIRFLTDPNETAKARAWAKVEGIRPEDIPVFIDSLVATTIKVDTRVTNNGFANGKPQPFQSLLERGTAVLVDANGFPRVRCKCGNPLLPAQTLPARARVRGRVWAGFDPTSIASVHGTFSKPVVIVTVNVTTVLVNANMIPNPTPTATDTTSPTPAATETTPEPSPSPSGEVGDHSGTYTLHLTGPVTGKGCSTGSTRNGTFVVKQSGSSLTFTDPNAKVSFKAVLEPDGTFRATDSGDSITGRFEGDQIVDGVITFFGCRAPFAGSRTGRG